MAEWILILIFQTQTGAGMTSVSGFASQAECERAGAAYVGKLGPVRQFSCIERPRSAQP